MDFRQKEALRKSRIFLVQNVEFDDLYDHLIDQDIFPDASLEYIRAGQERTQQVRRMLDNLIRRPNICFSRFQQALTNAEQTHCADEILKNYVQSGPTQVSDDRPGQMPQPDDVEMLSVSEKEDLPCGLPETIGDISLVSRPVQESCASQIAVIRPGNSHEISCHGDYTHSEFMIRQLQSYSFCGSQYSSLQDDVYLMETNPRGLALVINNEEFDHMSPRPGSKMDMQRLHCLFKMLGFAVQHQLNLTAQRMKDLLWTFSQYEQLREVSSLVVVILSHGGRNGVIYGKDGHTLQNGYAAANSYITDEEVRDFFSTRKCPLMEKKPKLIIVQACRGKNEDLPLNSSASSSCSSSLHKEGGSSVSTVSSANSQRTADMADICLIHSSASGYVSYRHPESGSPFIQTLTNVFMEFAATEHLLDLMTRVTRQLSARSLNSDDVRTVPSTTQMLTKKWFLNPLKSPA